MLKVSLVPDIEFLTDKSESVGEGKQAVPFVLIRCRWMCLRVQAIYAPKYYIKLLIALATCTYSQDCSLIGS